MFNFFKKNKENDTEETIIQNPETVETPETEQEPAESADIMPESAEAPAEANGGFFAKLKAGLGKTRDALNEKVDSVLKVFKKIDEDLYEELEEALIMADVGVETST